jgi:DNA mismatch repair protein MutL
VWNAPSPSYTTDLDRPPLFLTQKPVQMPMPSPRDVASASGGPPAVHATDEHNLRSSTTTAAPAPTATMAEKLPLLRAVGQVNATYVVAEGPDGMYLVDQHAAHERVLYERFLAAVRAGKPEVQGLLEPLTVELSPPHRALLSEHAAEFARLGFEIDHFGDDAYVLRAVPASLAGDDVPRQVTELLDRLGGDDAAQEPGHRVAASLACHAAVRAGMGMSEAEQRELLRLLERSASPRTCPHGRPTMVHLPADAIAREFRRK